MEVISVSPSGLEDGLDKMIKELKKIRECSCANLEFMVEDGELILINDYGETLYEFEL